MVLRKTYTCLVCSRKISGYRPAGDDRVWSAQYTAFKQVIAEAIALPDKGRGYAHPHCKMTVTCDDCYCVGYHNMKVEH